jgi:thioredoxin reductase (NADPH)
MQPVILVVVEDEGTRERLLDELRRYERDYQVEAAYAASQALARLGELSAAGEPVAMVLAHIAVAPDGVDLLVRTRAAAPKARRLLLLDWGLRPEQMPTVYRATSLGLVDTVVTTPTGPRDEAFHGAITEELGEWAWATTPVIEAVKVVVSDANRIRAEEIRAMLERHGVPTGVHAVDSPDGRRITAAAGPGAELPLVEVMGRTVLAGPTNREMAVSFGVSVEVEGRRFDLVIVGGGPAGLGAAVYGASEGLSTVVIEAEAFGGQAGTSSMIRNYLGFPRGVTGRELGRRGTLQASGFGAEFDLARAVIGLEPGVPHRLTLDDGMVAAADAVLLACGVTYRRLGVEALEQLVGAGVFYGAAASQARALEGARVVVVGAGNSGGQAAVHLARHAAHVTLVARGAALRDTMSAYLVDEIAATARIEVRTDTEVVDGGGDGRLEWLDLAHRPTGGRERIPTTGLFVLIGAQTRTGWLPTDVQRDEHGFVLTGAEIDVAGWPLARPPFALETSVPGVFAAGDVRANGVKRVAAAVGEGAVSVPMIHRFLAERAGQRPTGALRHDVDSSGSGG